jgi:hypothetical protein
MFQKKSEGKHLPSIGMARDRQVGRSLWLLVEMSRAKNFAQPQADLEFRLFCAPLPDS